MRNTLLACIALVGCATDDGAPVDENSIELGAKYTLQPGEEKYFCYTTRLPADRDVAFKRFTPTYGVATHHILLSQTIATEPEGFSECATLFKTTWIPLYTGGLDSGVLELPGNVAFPTLEKGQQVLMQLHLQNATDQPITAETKMLIEFVDKTPDIVAAGIYGMDNRAINIPPGNVETQTAMSCNITHDAEVFAVMGHMHKQGTWLDFSRGETAGSEMIYDEAWLFETQPVTPKTFSIKANDKLHLRCKHKNNGSQPLLYGESSDTEMCAFVLYYAPADGPLDGCIHE